MDSDAKMPAVFGGYGSPANTIEDIGDYYIDNSDVLFLAIRG